MVLRVSLLRSSSTSKLVQKPEEVLSVGKTRSPTGLALSPSGDWLVAIGSNTSYIAATSALQSGFTKFVSPDHLTCLAFHPTEEYYATGDSKGCVRLWYCIGQNPQIETFGLEKKSQTSLFHWHAHAVASIAFTSNGSYLLSGGEESVLVIWQVHTGRKEFVPRVGAAINSITVLREGDGPEEYLLGLIDATYLFINPASLKVSRTVSQIKLGSSIILALRLRSLYLYWVRSFKFNGAFQCCPTCHSRPYLDHRTSFFPSLVTSSLRPIFIRTRF